MVTRRGACIAIGAAAFAPLAALSQQKNKIWRVGFLAQRHLEFVDSDVAYGPFTQGLRDLGYVLGKNLTIEWRSAEGKTERLPELAAELVRLKVDVLATQGTPAAQAAQRATTTIPIVMIGMGDPVGTGLVKNLARPGGNSTGLSIMTTELGPKLLEMLRTTVPNATRVAVLVNPGNTANVAVSRSIQAAAQKIGVEIQPVEAATPQEVANGFTAMAHQKATALIVTLESFFQQQRYQIVELATKHRLPSIGAYPEFVEAGGLMSYGQSIRDNFGRAAYYVDRILKGANPGDLPVEQPMRFEMVINMRTAKALGITVPPTILVQATRVIE